MASLLPDTAGMDSHLATAHRILARAPLIDGHNDLTWVVRERAGGDVAAYDLRRRTPGRTDLERLAAGRVRGQFWAAYLACDAPGSGFDTLLAELALARAIFAAYPDRFAEARTADELLEVVAGGRIACLLAVEGGQLLGGSLASVDELARLGVRYLTLTHNCTTDWADAALGEPRHGGLTPFGVRVIERMNSLGMMVDLSHASVAVMHAALDVSEAPVIWSHSNARALVDHARNVPDEVLARVPANGGIVMATFVPAFVSAGPEATLEQVADHLDHLRARMGADHVGLGSDFDGSARVVRGLEDVATFPALIAELARRGWSEGDLEKLTGGNILRVLRAAEAAIRKPRTR